MTLILLAVLGFSVGGIGWAMSKRGYRGIVIGFEKEAGQISDLRHLMGKANWHWDPGMNCHIPVCRYLMKGDGYRRCGNGPLSGDEINEGYCSEHK